MSDEGEIRKDESGTPPSTAPDLSPLVSAPLTPTHSAPSTDEDLDGSAAPLRLSASG